MFRRTFLASTAAFSLQAAPKLNVIIILADDLGTGDVACYSREAKVRTPHLDKLSRQGMRFTDAHSPSSVCTPTRYGLLTGRYSWRSRLKSGVLNGYSPNLIEDGRPTLPSLFQKNGYRTGGFGKWHLGLGTTDPTDYAKDLSPSPLTHGFDEYFGIPASLDMPPYLYFDGKRAVAQPTNKIADNGEVKRGPYYRGGPIAPGFLMEEVMPRITERAINFVQKPGPFFCYVPLPAPHTPWVPTKAFQGRSPAKLYGDFVEQVDDSIGRIVNAVDTSNTLVIVTSDNGAPWEKRDMEENGGQWANLMMRGQKSDAYEAGHRVPFIVRWPGKVKPATVSNAPICHTDLFATCCTAAGIPIPKDAAEDSFPIQPALAGKQGPTTVRPHLIHHSGSGLFAIREGRWKLIEGLGSGGFTAPAKITPQPGGPQGQLFDIIADPNEREDIYLKHPDQVARLTKLLNELRDQGRTRPA